MSSDYYLIKMVEESIQYTALVTTEGHYKFLKMPSGLVNAPAAFNRMIRKVKELLPEDDLLIYLDEVLIPSKTVVEKL